MPARQRDVVNTDKSLADAGSSVPTNSPLPSATNSVTQPTKTNDSAPTTSPSPNSLASNPPSPTSDNSTKVQPEGNSRPNRRPFPIGSTPPPGYSGGGPNNFGPGSFPFGPVPMGSNAPPAGPPPGSMKRPQDFKPPDGVRITIENVDSIQLNDRMIELCKEFEISSSAWTSSNNEAKVGLGYAGSMAKLRDAIDFGQVIHFDEKEREMTIQVRRK